MSAELATLVAVMADLADSFEPTADPVRTLDLIARAAVDAIPGVDKAVISTRLRGAERSRAYQRTAGDLTGCAHVVVDIAGPRGRRATLDLYSRSSGSVEEEPVEPLARLFASQVSVMVSALAAVCHLDDALTTRQVIGQASGIMMQRSGVDAADAFDELVKISQSHNVKLRDVARELVESQDVGARR